MSIRADNFEAIGFGDSKTPNSLRNAYSIFIELPIKKELLSFTLINATLY